MLISQVLAVFLMHILLSQLGRVTFVEKDESAINKKDKYAKAEQQCDNNKEALNETSRSCDTMLDSVKSEGVQPKTDDGSEYKDSQSPNQKNGENKDGQSPDQKNGEIKDRQSPNQKNGENKDRQSPDQNENKDRQNPKQKKQEGQPREAQSQEVMSSILATMWMGDEHGNIYVHSSVANWAQCLHTVKMKDAVIAIV